MNNQKMIYNILEVANTHGGQLTYVEALLEEYEQFKGNFGVKFQPFKYDRIATADFAWYHVYEQLYFSPQEWQRIIQKAKESKDVWIDVFDTYSAEIVAQNSDQITGLKMQASVLYNYTLHSALAKLDLSDKKLILNISAYEIEAIQELVTRIEQQLQPQEVILQIGFQAYPTKVEDSALSKIATLQKHFPQYAISYTEHIDGKVQESVEVPVLAALLGATYLEKHIMHSSLHTEYDHYSSVVVEKYQAYINRLERYTGLLTQPFINAAEQQYLDQSLQIPILKVDKRAGECLSIREDVEFKRSNQTGLNVVQVQDLLRNFHVLRHDKKAGEALTAIDFKRAKVAALVACRMKSSRLPKKAILPIGDLPSVEVCLRQLLTVPNLNEVILATSTEAEDAVLENYTYHDDVIFHKGHPEDVVERFLSVAEPRDIDIIVRVTADCPYVSSDIIQRNLKEHFENGADFTSAPTAPVGINAEILTTTALRRVKEFFPAANYSEYMTFYFMNNPQHFRLHLVELPVKWQRPYRLTLDYQEDLDLFRAIATHFEEKQLAYSLDNILQYLDEHPEVAALNNDQVLVYKSNEELIKTLNEHTTIPVETP